MSWGQEPPEGPGSGRERDNAPGWGEDPPPPPPPAQPSPGSGPPSGWGEDPAPNRLRPLNLGDVLDGMFRLAMAHWRAFAIGIGVIVIPLSLLTALAVTLAFGAAPGFIDMMNDPEVAENFIAGTVTPSDFTGIARIFGTLALTVVISLLLAPLIYGVAVHVAAVGYRAGEVNPMDSVRAAGRRYFALLGTTFLLGLALFLLFLATVVLTAILASISDVGPLLAIVVLLAGLVVIVIAAIRLAVTIPALMIEGIGPFQALSRSNELIKGKTGLTFGTLLVVGIIVTIIGLVLQLPFGLVAGAVGNETGVVADTIGQIVGGIVQDTLLGAAVVLIYFDRRVRTEGYDLTELAGELGERRDQTW